MPGRPHIVTLAATCALATVPAAGLGDDAVPRGASGSVSAGPAAVSQRAPGAGALNRCATSVSYPRAGRNPALDEPRPRGFTSNVPLRLRVLDTGDRWWGYRVLELTNRGTRPFSVDCAVIVFLAASGSDAHSYANAVEPFGHPQQDYLEVPRGDGTSVYVVRLGFHDVPLAQRMAYPGKPFRYRLGGEPGPISRETTRDSVSFVADLDLSANAALVRRYGTKRYAH
jgi:hypothetical protein